MALPAEHAWAQSEELARALLQMRVPLLDWGFFPPQLRPLLADRADDLPNKVLRAIPELSAQLFRIQYADFSDGALAPRCHSLVCPPLRFSFSLLPLFLTRVLSVDDYLLAESATFLVAFFATGFSRSPYSAAEQKTLRSLPIFEALALPDTSAAAATPAAGDEGEVKSGDAGGEVKESKVASPSATAQPRRVFKSLESKHSIVPPELVLPP